MAIGRKSLQNGKSSVVTRAAKSLNVADHVITDGKGRQDEPNHLECAANERAATPLRRVQQGVLQFPMQILVPEETRNALRQRSEETGASIRHIILRSLAADGFPVPRLTRRR